MKARETYTIPERPPDPPPVRRRACRCEWPKLSESEKGRLCPRCGWPREEKP